MNLRRPLLVLVLTFGAVALSCGSDGVARDGRVAEDGHGADHPDAGGGSEGGGADASAASPPLVGAIDGATAYVVPAIGDVDVFADTELSASAIRTELTLSAAPTELESASFVLRASQGPLTSLKVIASDLTGPAGKIDAKYVDLNVVKVWWQSGRSTIARDTKQLVPELLLKDDGLITVEGSENYAKVGSQKVWISNPNDFCDEPNDWLSVPIADFPIQDSDTLQPVNIAAGTQRQFWVTVEVPLGTAPGDYAGALTLTTDSGKLGQLVVRLRVLPIALREPVFPAGLYYNGALTPSGSISAREKTEAQYRAEMRDLARHGVKRAHHLFPLSQSALVRQLEIRAAEGMEVSTLLLEGNTFGADSAFRSAMTAKGVKDIFLYGVDESSYEDNIAAIEDIHARGFKAFVALIDEDVARALSGELDMMIGLPYVAEVPGMIKAFNDAGHKVMSYSNPQVGVENPWIYRRNYGLYLWQHDYDGSLDWAYQGAYCTAWNDFDHSVFRDHMFTYPTVNGVVGTRQWEGFREGVDDLRYLATLLYAIDHPAPGKSAAVGAAEAWLDAMKGKDLTDLDATREEMIQHILALSTP